MRRRKLIRLLPLSIAGLPKIVSAIHPFPPLKHHDPLAIRYIKRVTEMLKWIRSTQSENLLEAAYAIARTLENGGRCWSLWDAGHTPGPDMFPDRNGEPDIFTIGYDINKTRNGDLLLATTFESRERFEDIKEKNITVVGAPSPWGGDCKLAELLRPDVRALRIRHLSDIWIETNYTSLGAQMYVHGMPAPVGPVTGIIQTVTLWMMVADACRVLARRGKSVPVKGDEPKLEGNNVKWVSLLDPLMDTYFDTVLRQMEMIGAEMGNIRKIAEIAVDTALSGGQVYCYSRYSSIAGEASTRRGGLSLTRGISEGTKDFNGTKKDCVIMGITKPDDEVDLKFLDMFKKRRMRIASLGPMTRDIKIPDGRTVPKETDVHAGRMCDTYGIFPIPGFDQKVCPTSGALLNQLFWAFVMELIEQYIERSGGNVPGVFFSAALKQGTEHMHRLHTMAREMGF